MEDESVIQLCHTRAANMVKLQNVPDVPVKQSNRSDWQQFICINSSHKYLYHNITIEQRDESEDVEE